MTAKLRRKWGLNFGEDDTKNRSNNRHHAIDTAVIAVCSVSMVKEFAIYCSRLREVRDSVIAEPWGGFADQVREAREWIIPIKIAKTLKYSCDGFYYLGDHSIIKI